MVPSDSTDLQGSDLNPCVFLPREGATAGGCSCANDPSQFFLHLRRQDVWGEQDHHSQPPTDAPGGGPECHLLGHSGTQPAGPVCCAERAEAAHCGQPVHCQPLRGRPNRRGCRHAHEHPLPPHVQVVLGPASMPLLAFHGLRGQHSIHFQCLHLVHWSLSLCPAAPQIPEVSYQDPSISHHLGGLVSLLPVDYSYSGMASLYVTVLGTPGRQVWDRLLWCHLVQDHDCHHKLLFTYLAHALVLRQDLQGRTTALSAPRAHQWIPPFLLWHKDEARESQGRGQEIREGVSLGSSEKEIKRCQWWACLEATIPRPRRDEIPRCVQPRGGQRSGQTSVLST